MNQQTKRHRTLTFVLLLGVVHLFSPASGLIPSAEGASASASARLIKKLKKQIATLKAQLAAATAVKPNPDSFIEMVTVGNVGNAVDPEDGDSWTAGIQNFWFGSL